jgi:uncharacterized RDD family membrane protein YckC
MAEESSDADVVEQFDSVERTSGDSWLTPKEFDPTALPKASSLARLAALFVDEVIAAGPMLLLGAIGYYAVADQSVPNTPALLISIIAFALGIFWPLFYMLMRDGWGHGQGWGKRLFGLLIMETNKGAFASKSASSARFIILALIGIIEAFVVLLRSDGRRLGDMLAGTQVVAEQAYAESGAPGAHTVKKEPASKTWPAVAFLISAVLIASSLGLISFTVSRLAPAPVSDEVAEAVYDDPGAQLAEDTIENYYEEILSGQYDAALARFDMPQEQSFAIVAVYSDSDAVLDSYRITEVDVADNEATVIVEESFISVAGDTLDRTVTYSLTPIEGQWFIASVESTEFDPIATAEAPVFYPRDAEITVDAFLGFIAVDDPVNARTLTTERFDTENPGYFDGSRGELTQWEVLGSEQLTSERLRVRVTEDWTSGTVTVDYQAAVDEGVLLVDTVSTVE